MSRRYALALADVVEKSGEAITVQTELNQWDAMMKESGDLLSLFRHPAIQYENKAKVLNSLLEKARPGKTAANFLRVLLRNQRLGDLTAINKAFATELAERSNQVSAFVTTAHELSADQKKTLQNSLNTKTGREVDLQLAVDQNIIGGVITQVGSTVYDSSVKTQLENLRQQLIKG
jgi:F-type H+-transporting ATPase subunit delta